MKRRKKPRAAGSPRERDPAESSAFHPYLLHFLEWFASRGYSPRTLQIRADGVRRFVRWADERGVRTPQDVTRPIATGAICTTTASTTAIRCPLPLRRSA